MHPIKNCTHTHMHTHIYIAYQQPIIRWVSWDVQSLNVSDLFNTHDSDPYITQVLPGASRKRGLLPQSLLQGSHRRHKHAEGEREDHEYDMKKNRV